MEDRRTTANLGSDPARQLVIVLTPPLDKYDDFQGVWINNAGLESLGLEKGSLAIVVDEPLKKGDLAAILEKETGLVVCGFFDYEYGIIGIDKMQGDPQLFDEVDVKLLGKIVGVCEPPGDDVRELSAYPIKL